MSGPRYMTRRDQEATGIIPESKPAPRNFVAPDRWEIVDEQPRPLPAQQVAGIPATVAPIVVDAGGKSFGSLQGDYRNHTESLLMKFGAVLALEGAIVLALLLLGLMQGLFGAGVLGAGWLVGTAGLGLLTFVILDKEEQKHTPVGSERHRVDKAADVATTTHRDTVAGWVDLNRHAIDRYYDYLERADDARERNRIAEQERRRLPGS